MSLSSMMEDWPGQFIHQATLYDNEELLSDLLQGDAIANINSKDPHGERTAVYTAVSNNSLKCLKVLLEKGANPSISAGVRYNMMSPLHQALMDGKIEAIKLLLDFGADIDSKDSSGMSVFNLARNIDNKTVLDEFEKVYRRRKQTEEESVRKLYESCRKCNIDEVKGMLGSPGDYTEKLLTLIPLGETMNSLCLAAQRGDENLMKLLLEQVDELRPEIAPIHYAVEAGHVKIVELLLQKCPECCRWLNPKEQSPLHVAAERGYRDMIGCLLEFPYPDSSYITIRDEEENVEYKISIDVNKTDVYGHTPLYLACDNGHEDVVEILLNFPVEVEGRSGDYFPVKVNIDSKNYKLSCIYSAVKNKHHDIVDMIIARKVDINILAREGDQEFSALLMVACQNEDIIMMDKLLQNNALDEKNIVLQEAVRDHPNCVLPLLKYRSSLDKHFSINRGVTRQSSGSDSRNFSEDESEDFHLGSSDSQTKLNPRVHAVNVRWQNLQVLATVEKAWLTYTGYHHNKKITHLDDQFALSAITRVDVSGNCLSMFPAVLFELPSLYTLNVSKNRITDFPRQEMCSIKCKSLEDLDLRNNRLITLPSYIFTEIPTLKVLNASSNCLQELPSTIWLADALATLDVSKNQLTRLPASDQGIWAGKSGRSDSTGSDPYENEPEQKADSAISKGEGFHDTDVYRCSYWESELEIVDVALNPSDSKKKGIKTLKLSENNITEFPDFLSSVAPYLGTLEMASNKLKRLGRLRSYPQYLKELDLSRNQFQDMNDWDKDDQDLHSSYTSSTSRVSMQIGIAHRRHKLENLEILDLSANGLKSITLLRPATDSVQESLGNSFNAVEAANQEIQGRLLFPNLTTLDLSLNKIESIPSEIGQMKELKRLSLKMNPIKELPPELGLLSSLWNLELERCPLEGHIQVYLQDSHNSTASIRSFLLSVLEESQEYNSMNLMIVGQFKIGKTSLLEQLRKKGNTFSKSTHFVERMGNQKGGNKTKKGEMLSTVGIDINDLTLDGKSGKVHFRTWDFGGQKEYYATHQYFLSPRSLYLVVWNLKDGYPGVDDLRQWLVNIQANASGAPVIIVGTHLDEVKKKRGQKSAYSEDWEATMTQRIHEKYITAEPEKSGLPYIIDIVNVSCVGAGISIDSLVKKVYDTVFELRHPARKSEKLLGQKVPKKYVMLQNCIQKLAKDRLSQNKEPVLNSDTYVVTVMEDMNKFVAPEGEYPECSPFRNKEDLEQATKFLHENGILCHFEDLALRDQYFIDPQWLCDQLAQVVSIKDVNKFAKFGVMKVKDLKSLYKASDKIGSFILSLLNKFEVALQYDKDNLILPSLLPTAKDLESPVSRKENVKIPLKRPAEMTKCNLIKVPLSIGNSTFYTQEVAVSVESSKPNTIVLIKTECSLNAAFSHCRLYILTYFPSGFWPRLITRLLADDFMYQSVLELFPFESTLLQNCVDLQTAVPSWRCWQTGLELVHFDNVLLQIKEIQGGSATGSGICDYSSLEMRCYFEEDWAKLDLNDSAVLEISFPIDTVVFFFGGRDSWTHPNQNFTSVEPQRLFLEEQAKAKILSRVVEHIDGLLQDWYPDIGEARFIQNCSGRYLVTRVIPCPLCLENEVREQRDVCNSWVYVGAPERNNLDHTVSIGAHHPEQTDYREQEAVKNREKRVIYSFLVERCVLNTFAGRDEICLKHGSVSPTFMMTEDGVNRVLYAAPDVVFHDLDKEYLVDNDSLQIKKEIGKGAFGKVFAGKYIQGTTAHDVAIKMLYSMENGRTSKNPAQMELETACTAYLTARQEVSILQTIRHPHIVALLGLSKSPLSLLLNLAPMGALGSILHSLHRDGLRLPVFVIKQVVIQVSDALDYLHERHIIYRDLKSDNILVWHFPRVQDASPTQPVLVRLADYGISRSVMPTGAKGYGGTPPFIAPEILHHAGRETYTEKVDIFSFGMFLFELITCRQPLEEIANPTLYVHNGGRPSITLEEAMYPSHMLDLMTICWSHEQEDRPSAAQIRMVASCPQFCHLSGTVSMGASVAVLSACSVYVEGQYVGPDDYELTKEDHTQIWVASQVGSNNSLDIFIYDKNNKCLANRSMTLCLGQKILLMCVVKMHVWCLDSSAKLQIFSAEKMKQVKEVKLETEGILFGHGMINFHENDTSHVIMLVQNKRGFLVFILDEDFEHISPKTIEPVRINKTPLCVAAIKSSYGSQLLFGQKQGQISVCSLSAPNQELSVLNHYDPPNNSVACKFIVTAMDSGHQMDKFVWTYNYPGSIVYKWNVESMKIQEKLDCSKLIPATESYHIQSTRKFEAKHYQVTALTVVDKHLYISTTWGCIIVADSQSLEPYSVFRCHGDEEFYVKAILPLRPVIKMASSMEWNMSSLSRAFTNDGIVTIGRGYVDIIRYVMQLDRQALARGEIDHSWEMVANGSMKVTEKMKDSSKGHTFLLSWTAADWEHY
ncbi:hypothetical protein CHS0354_025515 [Potamilus streckersoni]|uniref:non-specific serine/threonine protein kinase n=1 Tax=Potamilus streckersoni TaxID=2493646 RepID=A0AAE0VWX1_9BIVA|nr:hypothetical protein CHS0354_025515 [Potamilus streckersoni]